MPLGAIAGSLLASPLADRLGRRPLMLIASTLSIAFVTVSYISDLADGPKNIDTRRAVFLLGKTGAGFGNGMLLVGVETWFSEVIPTKGPLRGAAMALFPVMTLVGQLLGAVVVQVALGAVPGSGDAGVDIEPTQYRACLAAQWPVAVAVLVVSFLMPESWVWLLGKGRIEAARRQWAKLQKSEEAPREAGISKWMLWQRRTSVSGAQQGSSLKDQTATLPSRPSAVTFEDIRLALEHEKHSNPHAAGRHSFYDLFRGSDRRRTLIVCLAMLVPIFFGLPLFATAGYFLQTIGMPAATSVIFIIIGVVLGLVSNVAAFWTLARFGRRRLLLSTLSVAAVGWLSVGIAGFFGGSDRPATVWYVAITLMAVLLVLGLGAWPASFAVGAETSSLVLRARTQGFAGATTNLATGAVSLALPYVYNPDQGNLGARVGLIFAVLCAIAVAAVWFLVPEMKNRSQRELDEMFELGLAARKFEHWRRPPQGHRITPPATANGAERMHQSDGLADDQRAQEHERLTQA